MAKTAVITGGSSGLGFALGELLGKQGYNIVILARNQQRINEAVSKLSNAKINAKGISCDTTDENGLRQAAAQVKKDFGSIDFLILNAGVVTTKLVSEYASTTEMKKDLEIDLWGTILSAHVFEPLLKSGSKVLMTSSGFGLIGVAGYSMYCAAKAGIINFGESFRRELLHKGINVYVTCPGDMDTPQFREEVKNAPAWMKKETPRKLMKTEVVAAKILNQAKGSGKYLIVPSGDVNLLVILSKILPRKFRDWLLDKMFPRPVEL